MSVMRVVVAVLATHLIASGGLMFIIGRQMPARSGLHAFALGSCIFGLAYLGRLAAGQVPAPLVAWLLDAAMVMAAFLFHSGLRQFLGREGWSRKDLLLIFLGFALAHGLITWLWPGTGRHVLLNVCLAVPYAMLAYHAARSIGSESGVLREPLMVLSGCVGILSALTFMLAMLTAVLGREGANQSVWTMVYYGYACVAAMLLSPNVLWMVFTRLSQQLRALATSDALSKALNRNGLTEVVTRHFGARNHDTLTVLQVDIDHFKRINDVHGHAAGDRVIHGVAQVLMKGVRAGDFVARTGGEEFLVGCVGCGVEDARMVAERLRIDVERLCVRVSEGGVLIPVTVSIGVVPSVQTKAQWDSALLRADAALYEAKAAGRNRVQVAAPVAVDQIEARWLMA